jgi:raffinose/stachyose/melibiose transport system substrate-binding protein
LKLNRRDLLTTAGVLTLASTGPASHAADASRVTLWDIATGDVKTLLQHTVQRFDQHHSDIDVVVEFFQNDPYKTKLRMAMGAGQPPDVFIGWGGGILQSYVESRKVIALPQSVNTSRFIDSVMRAVTFNGHVYGVPCRGTQPVLFYYNKPIFQK